MSSVSVYLSSLHWCICVCGISNAHYLDAIIMKLFVLYINRLSFSVWRRRNFNKFDVHTYKTFHRCWNKSSCILSTFTLVISCDYEKYEIEKCSICRDSNAQCVCACVIANDFNQSQSINKLCVASRQTDCLSVTINKFHYSYIDFKKKTCDSHCVWLSALF